MRLKVYNNHNIKSNNNNTIPITCIINKTNEHETINNTNVIVNKAEKVNEAVCADKQTFVIGDTVEHIEEKIKGKISFIGETKLAINWEDNTKERFTFDDADKELKKIEAYVDTTESEVNPLESSSSNPEKVVTVQEAVKADSVKIESVDIEKEKLQHKIDKLENKITNNMTANMKEKVANELVDLAISKGMLDEDDRDLEIVKLSSLNDEEMKQYEQDVINYSDEGNIVELANESEEEEDYAGLSDKEVEAKKALKSLRFKGSAKGIPTSSRSASSCESRNLSEVKYDSANVDPRTFTNNQNELEESLASLLGSIDSSIADNTNAKTNVQSTATQKAKKSISRHASIHEQKHESLPGFENLQGLKRPLVMGNSEQFKSSNSIKDAFNDFNWTTISRK